jgi:hypothetical protein
MTDRNGTLAELMPASRKAGYPPPSYARAARAALAHFWGFKGRFRRQDDTNLMPPATPQAAPAHGFSGDGLPHLALAV